MSARYLVADEHPGRDAEWLALPEADRYNLDRCPSIVLTRDELAAVNEPETMEEIDALRPGQSTILGQCDPIRRLS